MKQALALVLAGSAFGAATDAGAATAPAAHPFVVQDIATAQTAPLLVDDDEGDDEGGWFWSNGGGSDDGNGGGSGGDSDDCNAAEDPTCAAGNAAPAGSVAPPKNGLFTDSTAPTVKSN